MSSGNGSLRSAADFDLNFRKFLASAQRRFLRPALRFGAGFDLAFEAALGAPAGYSPAFFSRTDQYSQARAWGRGCRLRSHAIFASPAVSGLKAWPCALHVS